MKAIGLIKELEPSAKACLPSIHELRDRMPEDAIATVASFLEAGQDVLDSMEATIDPLDPKVALPGGSSLKSDGHWAWRADLAYFVKKYAIGLHPSFLQYALSTKHGAVNTDSSKPLPWKPVLDAFGRARNGEDEPFPQDP